MLTFSKLSGRTTYRSLDQNPSFSHHDFHNTNQPYVCPRNIMHLILPYMQYFKAIKTHRLNKAYKHKTQIINQET